MESNIYNKVDNILEVNLGMHKIKVLNELALLKIAIDNDSYYSIAELKAAIDSTLDTVLSDLKVKYGH